MLGGIFSDEVDGIDDARVWAAGVAAETFEAKDFGFLCDAVSLAGDAAAYVGAVAVVVSVGAFDPGLELFGATFEFLCAMLDMMACHVQVGHTLWFSSTPVSIT